MYNLVFIFMYTYTIQIKDAAKNAIITAKPIPSVNECLPKSEEIKETAIINNKSTVLKKNLGNMNKISSISKTKKPNNFGMFNDLQLNIYMFII